MVKISIVIPVYNCEKYLEQCIRSVLCQSLKEIEIICIDDGSIDYSSQIIQSFQLKDARLILLRQENQGSGVARNLGIQKATGKYIAFLDADDYYIDRNALELMFHKCEDKNLAVCGSLRKCKREGTKEIDEMEEIETLFQGISTDEVFNYWEFQLDYYYQSFLFSRKFLVENNIFFPDYRRFQDPPFLVRALYEAGKFAVADTYLYCYRVSDMAPRFNPQKVNDLLHGLMDNLQFAREHNLKILFRNTVQRIEDEYVDIICKNLLMDDLSILKSLLQMNQLISDFYGDEFYVIQPLRTILFSMNQYSYREEVLKRLKGQDEIAIYGAGKYGKLFLGFLKRNHLQSKVKYFVVSDLVGNKSQIEGIPVVVLSDFIKKSKRFVYVTVRREFREKVRQALDRYEYQDYEMIKEEFLHVIALEAE